MKKVIIVMVAMLTFGMSSVTFAAANPFSDVPADHWAYNAVTTLAAKGIIEGEGDGTFLGNKNATRYYVAVLVAKLYEMKTKNEIVTSFDPFSDLPLNYRAAEAVVALAKVGIVESDEDRPFLGNNNITRGELRNMLNNLFSVTAVDARMKDYPDENKTLTRYELAATLNKVYEAMFN